MMKFHTKAVLFSALTTVILACTSCIKDDVYDPTALQEEAKKTFPTTIGTNQTWNMVGTTTFNVGVNEDAGQTYTIKVLDKDPIGNSSAKLLATGTVTNGQTVALKFNYPLADSTLYISRVDSKLRREVTKVSPVDSGSVSYNFGSTSTTKTRATTRAIGDFTNPTIDGTTGQPYTENDLATDISSPSALQITEGMDISSGSNKNYTVYYVTGNITNINGTNSGLSGKKIIIANGGTWNVAQNTTISSGVEVIVANGGEINLNGQTLSSNQTSGYSFIVMPGGTITNGNLSNTSTGGSFYNGGTMNLSAIKLLGGYLINADGATFYSSTISLLSNATLINHSENCHIGATNDTNNNANYENSCKIIIDSGAFMPLNLTISNGASIQCKNLILQGTTVNLGNDAILKATNSTAVQGVTVNGPSSGDHAICVLSNIIDNGWGSGNFNNLIYVDVTSIPSTATANPWSWWNSNVNFGKDATEVGQGEAKQVIPAGDCSIGYTMVDNGGDKTNPTYQFTYAFEDMMRSIGDYDFNDVVLKVSAVINNKVYVEMVAGGAEKNLYVHLKEGTKVTDLFGGKEIHDAFGVNKGAMVNTDAGPTAATVTDNVTVNSDYYGDFYITDQYNNEVHIPAFTPGFKTGNAPYALLVPGDWAWPKETVSITKAYTGFDAWAADATQSIEWYATGAVSSNIYGN